MQKGSLEKLPFFMLLLWLRHILYSPIQEIVEGF